jgi:hypothetical protein
MSAQGHCTAQSCSLDAAQEYTYKGRVVGSFFDENGLPTARLRQVLEGAARHKAAEEERKNKHLAYPSCNTRWSSDTGANFALRYGQSIELKWSTSICPSDGMTGLLFRRAMGSRRHEDTHTWSRHSIIPSFTKSSSEIRSY